MLIPQAIVQQAASSGFSLIQDQSVSGVSTIDFTSIPATYRSLLILIDGATDHAGAGQDNLSLRVNNDSGANYYSLGSQFVTTGFAATEGLGQNSWLKCAIFPGATALANSASSFEMWLPDYAATTLFKTITVTGTIFNNTTTTNVQGFHFAGSWIQTAAINRLTFFTGANNFIAGTRATLYGFGAA